MVLISRRGDRYSGGFTRAEGPCWVMAPMFRILVERVSLRRESERFCRQHLTVQGNRGVIQLLDVVLKTLTLQQVPEIREGKE